MAAKEYVEGAQWRRWDLHIHTPGTNKNDQFTGSDIDSKWKKYCDDLNSYDGEVAVVGVTDYWSIDNYFKFKDKLASGSINKDIHCVIPNVEMRVTPITGNGKPVNIHCLFNPALDDQLEDRFFQKLTISHDREFAATKSDLINFGRKIDGDEQLGESQAYKIGVNNFVVEWRTLESLFKKDVDLRNNTVIVVSNKSTDGASGVVQHKDFFTDQKLSQLESHRRGIYKMSDAIFSSRPKDVEFFYGAYPDYEKLCGKPKPCFHGSDAHENIKIFEPADDRYCWIKADPNFEGLLQTMNEPEDRVFIGSEPAVLKVFEENKTKYIKAITIDSIPGYQKEQGVWFDGIRLSFNKQLVAIIGNKGSGKSALADILALCGETSTGLEFLTNKKFKKNGLASKFAASMYWDDNTSLEKGLAESVDLSSQERVKYLSQNYFESLCSDIDQAEGFRRELENVVFSHLPIDKRYGCNTFDDLVNRLKGVNAGEINNVRAKLQAINEKLKNLEVQRNEKYISKLKSNIEVKEKELDAHDSICPEEIENPNKDKGDEVTQKNEQVESTKTEINKIDLKVKETEKELIQLSVDREEIKQIQERVSNLEKSTVEVKQGIGEELGRFGIAIDDVIKVSFHYEKIEYCLTQLLSKEKSLKTLLDGDGGDKNLGLKKSLEELEVAKNKLLEELGAPEKKYQKYLADVTAWKLRRQEIVGATDSPNTLEGLKFKKLYLKGNVQQDIDALRAERHSLVREIFLIKMKLVDVYKHIKVSVDEALKENHGLLGKYDVTIKACFNFNDNFVSKFLFFVNQNKSGSFYGKDSGQLKIRGIIEAVDPDNVDNVVKFLDSVIGHLEKDYRDLNKKPSRFIDEQIQDLEGFYDYLFSLDYLTESYSLEMGGKQLQQLSPGEKGALLLIFYLLLDKDNKPLIIDQPEDNLDNQSVSRILVPFIKKAKMRRQIFMVTHNPNLAVVADAEQIVHVNIAKDKNNAVSVKSGSIENSEVNLSIVNILEGTMPAFRKRDNKYFDE